MDMISGISRRDDPLIVSESSRRPDSFSEKSKIDKHSQRVDITADFDFIVGVVAGDKPTSNFHCLRWLT